MTLYSKNGSYPYPYKDGTDGWIEVPDEPVPPAGKEVVWWYPPGWVVRPVAPGPDWSWSQSQGEWVSPPQPVDPPTAEPEPSPAPPAPPSGNVTV